MPVAEGVVARTLLRGVVACVARHEVGEEGGGGAELGRWAVPVVEDGLDDGGGGDEGRAGGEGGDEGLRA